MNQQTNPIHANMPEKGPLFENLGTLRRDDPPPDAPPHSPVPPNSPHSPYSRFLQRDNYPAPPAEAAYHGLAGEIVRLIEPHTEGDPVALLFQLLAAFGNIIGRDAWMIADGAQHCMNLFGVLVGYSSKGRKGTSWNHILTLLRHVDEAWASSCIKSGLNSGEGLIYHLRDPGTRSVPDKESPGGYRQEPTEGVTDKRLFISEGEFASILTVMGRESNTLSATIRCAWDTGNLTSLTKNSPDSATGAHVSIAAHITRSEINRLLKPNEAANGFANRFWWLATQRSKSLPDGGDINAVELNNVAIRLKAAVNHARGAGRIFRSEPARALWHEAYERLSMGKPGMVGDITARAEAQVMRLSAIYALLDGSAIIHPEHHHAAIALWEYSERSIVWIFGTITGDKKADRILEALRLAGPAGMTRTEITEVFNGHVSVRTLEAALEILHAAGLATHQLQKRPNGVTERWFAIL